MKEQKESPVSAETEREKKEILTNIKRLIGGGYSADFLDTASRLFVGLKSGGAFIINIEEINHGSIEPEEESENAGTDVFLQTVKQSVQDFYPVEYSANKTGLILSVGGGRRFFISVSLLPEYITYRP